MTPCKFSNAPQEKRIRNRAGELALSCSYATRSHCDASLHSLTAYSSGMNKRGTRDVGRFPFIQMLEGLPVADVKLNL